MNGYAAEIAESHIPSVSSKITTAVGRKGLTKMNNPASIANRYSSSLQSVATTTQAQNNTYNLSQVNQYNDYLAETTQQIAAMDQGSLSPNKANTQTLDKNTNKNITGINLSNTSAQQRSIASASADILGTNNNNNNNNNKGAAVNNESTLM